LRDRFRLFVLCLPPILRLLLFVIGLSKAKEELVGSAAVVFLAGDNNI
jgi:hypothetical protein